MTIAAGALLFAVVSAAPDVKPSIGLVVSDLSKNYATKTGCPVRSGVFVRGVLADRPAVLAGFKQADVISRIDEQATPDLDSFAKWAEQAEPDRTYKVTVYRQREAGVWWRLRLLLKPLRRR